MTTSADVLNYNEQGGARTVIGGEIDIVSGGALKVAGTDKTAALAAAVATPAAGVAASYKVARGETALDGTNPTPVATGLATVVGFTATLKGTAAPGVGTSALTANIAGAADVREPANPVSIATLPTPAEEDFCAKGAKFGPHNLHENRPGSMQTEDLIFATYHNAGLRIYDVRDPFAPKQVGYFVPPAPDKIVDQRPNPAKVIQSCDVFVDKEGLMYLTDTNAGLYILQYEGH